VRPVVVVPEHARDPRLLSPDLVEPADRHEAPARDHRGPVAQLGGLVEVVRGEEDRRALGLELADQVPEAVPGLGVEARGRLVEEEELGAADDPEGHVHPPALAARERAEERARLLGEADGLDRGVDVARPRVHGGEVRDLLAHGHRAALGARLEHHADAGAPGAAAGGGIHAEHGRGSARAQPVPLEDLDGGRLARAVRPEEGERLAAMDVEGDAPQGGGRAVGLLEVAHADVLLDGC
jgi:hypothetical protein